MRVLSIWKQICFRNKILQGHCYVQIFKAMPLLSQMNADPSGRAVSGIGLRPLAFSDRWFESRLRHGYLSVVSVVCC